VTSRRSSVRVSVRPVDLGPLTEGEMIQFASSLGALPGFSYVQELTEPEVIRIGLGCDGIPLAIRWVLSRCGAASDAISMAATIASSSKQGEELLEFCFQRIFDSMPSDEKRILQVLSLFSSPLPMEACFRSSKKGPVTAK
jgi:hypothetical protein